MSAVLDASHRELLTTGLAKLGLPTSSIVIDQLLGYVALLIKWSAAYNLIADPEPRTIIVKHILDSLSISPYVSGPRILDFGSGAGLPGIPLAIMHPSLQILLVDSRAKRTLFLQQVARELALTQVDIIENRVEKLALAQPVNCIVVRAVAEFNAIIANSEQVLAADGQYLFMQGKAIATTTIINTLPSRFELVDQIALTVPYLAASRQLMIVRSKI